MARSLHDLILKIVSSCLIRTYGNTPYNLRLGFHLGHEHKHNDIRKNSRYFMIGIFRRSIKGSVEHELQTALRMSLYAYASVTSEHQASHPDFCRIRIRIRIRTNGNVDLV